MSARSLQVRGYAGLGWLAPSLNFRCMCFIPKALPAGNRNASHGVQSVWFPEQVVDWILPGGRDYKDANLRSLKKEDILISITEDSQRDTGLASDSSVAFSKPIPMA
jgi:hypothetical protein